MGNRVILAVAVFTLLAAGVQATGQPDKGGTSSAGASGARGGKVVYYATPADYERATGKKPGPYAEAPQLAAEVKAGRLPPVAARLPEEPLVVAPATGIGAYGGVIKAAATNPNNTDEAWSARSQPLFMVGTEDPLFRPNVAKGWEMSADARTLTIHLRKGMKWSDGQPFTADDFVFWYNDILQNKELTAVPDARWRPGGKLFAMNRLDEVTLQFVFAVPHPSIVAMLANENRVNGQIPFAPAHFLKKFHIKYNPGIEKEAKDKGFDAWWKYFNQVFGANREFAKTPGHPTLDPWVVERFDEATGNQFFVRNPYYFKVDTAGNQLPYIDRQELEVVQNVEVLNLKIIAGQIDYAALDIQLASYPLLKENEAKGGYEAKVWYDTRANVLADLKLNWASEDPVKRALFQDLRFRQALSVAINRDEINKVIYLGLATPRAATIRPDASFYEDWMGKHFAQYDPKLAAQLLDEMGLKWDATRKYRLRPDGKELALNLEYLILEGPRDKVCELVKGYWEAVGIRTNVKDVGNNYGPLGNANKLDFQIWHLGNSEEIGIFMNSFGFDPYAPPYQQWRVTGGAQGEEPPAVIKQYYDLAAQFATQPYGSEGYKRLGKELVSHHVRNLLHIGLVGMTPKAAIVKKALANVPDKDTWGYVYRFWTVFYPDQWYWTK